MANMTKKKRSGFELYLWIPFSILIIFVGGALLWNVGISFVRWYGYGPITWNGQNELIFNQSVMRNRQGHA